MAVVSEGAFYQAKIAPSYVSSSGYYGYVAPNPIANYDESALVNNAQLVAGSGQSSAPGFSWSLSVPQQQAYHHSNCTRQELLRFNGSAMETDEDDNRRREFVRVSRCENNHCVIPEAEGDGGGGGGSQSPVYRVSNLEGVNGRRANRKRNSTGDPAYLFFGHPVESCKKPRQETVVTASFAMVTGLYEDPDRPRCVMSREH